MSLKIITKNKRLKATRDSLEKEISILKEKVSTLKKNKEVDLECVKCHMLKIENEKLKEEALKLTKFEKSTHCLNEMLNNQKPFGEKLGLGFNSFEASSSGTKEIKFVKAQKKASSDGVIMESLVKKKQKGAILELKRRHLKNTIFCTYTPYPAMKIRRISASSAQETRLRKKYRLSLKNDMPSQDKQPLH
ncbi:hypothetical protein Tco_1363022 [Tanacetum coccineum]